MSLYELRMISLNPGQPDSYAVETRVYSEDDISSLVSFVGNALEGIEKGGYLRITVDVNAEQVS